MTSSQAETTLKQNEQPHKSPLINQGLRWPWTLVSFSCTSRRVFRMAGHLSSGKFALGTTLACSVYFLSMAWVYWYLPSYVNGLLSQKTKQGLILIIINIYFSQREELHQSICAFSSSDRLVFNVFVIGKKIHFFQGWVQEDWKPVHASLISSWCSLHQCAREYFALWNGFWL